MYTALKTVGMICVVGLIVMLITALVEKLALKANKARIMKHMFAIVFAFYIISLINVTFFIYRDNDIYKINLIPFSEIAEIINNTIYIPDIVKMIILQILLFVPYGVLAPVVIDKARAALLIFCGVGISVGIEVLQFITHKGILDVSDIIYNTLGILIGYGLYRLAVRKHAKSMPR